jgi:hypothetical protein
MTCRLAVDVYVETHRSAEMDYYWDSLFLEICGEHRRDDMVKEVLYTEG